MGQMSEILSKCFYGQLLVQFELEGEVIDDMQ